MTKGVFPGAGRHYFLHYFLYSPSVVDHQGICANGGWYGFYYFKDAGLCFFFLFLTDPLAPQVVSFCFVAAAGLVVWLFIQRSARGTLWPWVGLLVFFGIYMHTPGRGEFMRHGGWGDFEKLHELNMAFVIAILWAS